MTDGDVLGHGSVLRNKTTSRTTNLKTYMLISFRYIFKCPIATSSKFKWPYV